jgi:predicted Zn-dependent peptidase
MLSLAFSEKSLDVQRKVVCEEFKEHYINKPYGDVWFKMRELAYKVHPYRWQTIGKELSHIENANINDVKGFFFKHYRPSNAILAVGGNVKTENVIKLAEKWFGDIPGGDKYIRNLPSEPAQTAARKLEVKAKVPLDALYKCWHIYPRTDQRYYPADLITEILSGGGSSRLYQALVKEQQLFNNIECSHFGSNDAGLLTIEGKVSRGKSIEEADKAIERELEKMKQELVDEKELQKVKNKTESMIAFEDMSVLNRTNSLALYELLGDANLMNTELEKYHAVSAQEIRNQCQVIFDEKNSNTLYYYSQS